MLAMHRDGVIVLPPPRGKQGRPRPIVFGPDTEPPLFPAPKTLDQVRPLDMRIVVRNTREGRLWNEFVARYHYLGYKPLVGAQMRYAVHDRNGWPLAMLGFSTAAWKLAPRDSFIGWSPEMREKNLPLVVDNPRFPDPALGRDPESRLAHPRHRAPVPAGGLDRALQHHAPCSSRPSSRRRATPAPSTAPRAGSRSEPHREEDAMTGIRNEPSRKRTSGCDLSARTGSERSIAESTTPHHRVTERFLRTEALPSVGPNVSHQTGIRADIKFWGQCGRCVASMQGAGSRWRDNFH